MNTDWAIGISSAFCLHISDDDGEVTRPDFLDARAMTCMGRTCMIFRGYLTECVMGMRILPCE